MTCSHRAPVVRNGNLGKQNPKSIASRSATWRCLSHLSGTPVRVFQSRYTIARVYRLMSHRVSHHTPQPPPLSWGVARLCGKHAASIAAQAAVLFLSRHRGVSQLYCRKSRIKTTLSIKPVSPNLANSWVWAFLSMYFS